MPLTPPRPPKLTPPSPPSTPRLSMSALRARDSVALDGAELRVRGRDSLPMPPYVRWHEFVALLDSVWTPGPPSWPNSNLALVGAAGSGKTTLSRELLKLRDYVVVFGTKTQDASLYEPLRRQGFVLVDEWNPQDTRHNKVIYRPPLRAPTREALAEQALAFHNAMLRVFQVGGWTLYWDEARYLSQTLKLGNEMDLLWLQGRSLGLTIVAGTQRPVSVPLNMFEQSRFLITFRITGRDDRKTMAAYTGVNEPVVTEAAAMLPPHEFLFVDGETDTIVRSRVGG